MEETTSIANHLNLSWVLINGMLVFFMQAGFAALESGLVRSKNAVNVLMKNCVDMCIGSIGFWVLGFGLMFGVNRSGYIGTNMFAPDHGQAEFFAFIFFQMMFAATAATIVSGALAERIRYWPYIFCALVICSIIYPVFGAWTWGSYDASTPGWLKQMGYIDFAGSSVVHCVGGWCALAGLLVLGPRTGRFAKVDGKVKAYTIPGHNLPLAAMGTFILWFGFFAFNCGSTLSAMDDTIALIALNTHMAGAAGVLGALVCSAFAGKPALLGTAINGGLAGLVAICAGANSISPFYAIVTGAVAGVIVMWATWFLEAREIDDAVGAVPVHAFGGTWGVLAAGLFQTGNLFNFAVVKVQVIGILVNFVWVMATSFIMYKLLGVFTGLRVDVAAERRGLDYVEHDELGYPEFQELLHEGGEG